MPKPHLRLIERVDRSGWYSLVFEDRDGPCVVATVGPKIAKYLGELFEAQKVAA
jgi:hypothetical protein